MERKRPPLDVGEGLEVVGRRAERNARSLRDSPVGQSSRTRLEAEFDRGLDDKQLHYLRNPFDDAIREFPVG